MMHRRWSDRRRSDRRWSVKGRTAGVTVRILLVTFVFVWARLGWVLFFQQQPIVAKNPMKIEIGKVFDARLPSYAEPGVYYLYNAYPYVISGFPKRTVVVGKSQ
jgi:hypothetical protein